MTKEIDCSYTHYTSREKLDAMTEEELVKKIDDLKTLKSQMGGQLYRGIVGDEISGIVEYLSRERNYSYIIGGPYSKREKAND
jgi:hypothetical protein